MILFLRTSGIAFEKGLALTTPERVPFRLTRDVVDGMGVLGIHGTFLRCGFSLSL
jgi:ataxia telangiectasia mutated family protein